VGSNVKQASEASSAIRFRMWRLALSSDRYIKNKWLGDGFQISRDELTARNNFRFGVGARTGGMKQEEMLMAMGSYHGFHVETIRFTGAAGLLAETLALIAFARSAGANVRYFRHHAEWGYVLFVCIPFLIQPLWHWLVWGAYRSEFPTWLALAGMVKLLDVIRQREVAVEAREPASVPASGMSPAYGVG